LKVAVLNNDFRVYWRGRLIYLREFFALKNSQLYAIELFGKGSPYDFDDYVEDGSQWWQCLFPLKSAGQLQGDEIKQALFDALDRLDPDIIIAPSIVFFAGAIGLHWAKINKRRFIMFDDARPAQVKRNFVVQHIKNRLIAQADALWLPSVDYDADYARFRSRGLHFFHGFSSIDNNLFKHLSNYHSHGNRIICVARLVPVKNIGNLLKAWYMVEQANSEAELLIVGDGPEMQLLKQQQQQLGLKRINFAGTIANQQLPLLLAGSAAFILPSLSETWGLVVNEAMAAGLPVLLSCKVNAAQSLLREGVNGYLFNPIDVDSIAAAILKFMDLQPQERADMSAASLKLVDTMSYAEMGHKLWSALDIIDKKPVKTPGFFTALIIKYWNGRYNTSGWDKL